MKSNQNDLTSSGASNPSVGRHIALAVMMLKRIFLYNRVYCMNCSSTYFVLECSCLPLRPGLLVTISTSPPVQSHQVRVHQSQIPDARIRAQAALS